MHDYDPRNAPPISLPCPDGGLVVERLDYANPYDFHKLHRHDYFEIILIREGHGNQRIDFSSYAIAAGQIYNIYPGQIHLMERGTAMGLLVQFRKEMFDRLFPLKHYHLYLPSPVMPMDSEAFEQLYQIAERMQVLCKNQAPSSMGHHKIYGYLQVFLISLVERHYASIDKHDHGLVSEFLSLLTQHIYDKKKVADYCLLLGHNAEKLNKACKKMALGKHALEIIHEEIMLEIRRLLLLGTLSLKEIAYTMNFDTPQNFSAFVKSKTGQAPLALQASIGACYGS